MLNSLYGKFSKNPRINSKYPYINMGAFITAYARYKTISTSQKIRDYSLEKYGVDYYIYSDT